MSIALPAKLFRTDDGQAVSIPHGLELPGDVAFVRREGGSLVIEPQTPRAANPANQALVDLLASWDDLDEEIGPIEDYPAEPVNL